MNCNHESSVWEVVASGTTAAILANVAVYPLDIVKTKLQVQVQRRLEHSEAQEDGKISSLPSSVATYGNVFNTISIILEEEGIAGLYRGLGSSVFNTASMNFAYFYWTAKARALHQSVLTMYELSDSNSIVKELSLGAGGGAMAQLFTNPIAVIVTRQQTSKAAEGTKSIWDIVKEVVNEDGWTGLWRGFKVNLILVVNPMITYGLYQWLRASFVRFRQPIRSLDAFLLGALSKVLATIATHPLIVAKTMLQSKPPESRHGRPFRSFTEVLFYIVRHEGVWRLYKGLGPQILKGFMVQGLMMMLKERTELLMRFVIALHRKTRSPAA